MTQVGISDPLQTAVLTAAGEPWIEARRQALRQRLAAGTLTSLEFQAVVYRTGPNTNHVRFRPEELPGFAASFVGLPFLRNHDVSDIGARDGIVLDSRLVGDEFHQRIRLTTRRGMRDFLEGVIDRFSIGWHYTGVECSICGQDWFTCGHWPGRRYPVEPHGANSSHLPYRSPASFGRLEGMTAVCELVFLEPTGKETSAVNAPAVPGTHIIEELCQLKEARVTMASTIASASSLRSAPQAAPAMGTQTASLHRVFSACIVVYLF